MAEMREQRSCSLALSKLPSVRWVFAVVPRMYVTGSCVAPKPSGREWALRLSVSASWPRLKCCFLEACLTAIIALVELLFVKQAQSSPLRLQAMGASATVCSGLDPGHTERRHAHAGCSKCSCGSLLEVLTVRLPPICIDGCAAVEI